VFVLRERVGKVGELKRGGDVVGHERVVAWQLDAAIVHRACKIPENYEPLALYMKAGQELTKNSKEEHDECDAGADIQRAKVVRRFRWRNEARHLAVVQAFATVARQSDPLVGENGADEFIHGILLKRATSAATLALELGRPFNLFREEVTDV